MIAVVREAVRAEGFLTRPAEPLIFQKRRRRRRRNRRNFQQLPEDVTGRTQRQKIIS